MTGSSNSRSNAFDGVQFKCVEGLLEILQARELRSRALIRTAFLQRYRNFSETLEFLIRLGLVRERNGNLDSEFVVSRLTGSVLQECVLDCLFRANSRYRSEVLGYLRKFSVREGEASYQPPVQDRAQESAVRNFLIEVGVVRYDSAAEKYVVSPEHLILLATAHDAAAGTSPCAFRSVIAARDEVGRAAEEAIVAFERKRLGGRLADRVDHVALRNVSAGYDIRSIMGPDSENEVPRFIEVKAVPVQSFQFYWTQNEVRVARLLGQLYYLYLLPVTRGGDFDISSLKIIADPHKVVLQDGAGWTVESEVVRCQLEQSSVQASTPDKSGHA